MTKLRAVIGITLGAGLLLSVFQNCAKDMGPAEATQSDAASVTTVITTPGGLPVTTVNNPGPSIQYESKLPIDIQQVVTGDPLLLESKMTSTAGPLRLQWYMTKDLAADVDALRVALESGDPVKLNELVQAGKVKILNSTGTLSIPTTAAADSGRYVLAAFDAATAKLLSVQVAIVSIVANIALVQAFSAPGKFTWHKPYKGTVAIVECVGGGGSGGVGGVGSGLKGPAKSFGGGGGGGGGYSKKSIPLTDLSATEQVVVGAGGKSVGGSPGTLAAANQVVNGLSPGSVQYVANGVNGGASIFGNNLVVAGGGIGGKSGRSGGAGGAGGDGSTAIGAVGVDGAVPGGRGGFAGGRRGSYGLGGANGTSFTSTSLTYTTPGSSGLPGYGGGGGGGSGGNGTGAPRSGEGGDGSCVITVQ